MRLPTIFLTAAALAMPLQGNSADSYHPLIYGAGNLSCGKWLEARDSPSEEMEYIFQSWFTGFLTATNNARPIGRVEIEAAALMLDQKCERNPTWTFMRASARVGLELAQEYDKN